MKQIHDPLVKFIDDQQDDLVDFIFRLTSDRSRAGVMGREACQQAQDELRSGQDERSIRRRLFELAYELNEEVMRPISAAFLKDWYEMRNTQSRMLNACYDLEMHLLELGHHASQLLLLRHRYRFSRTDCATILNRERDEIEKELEILEELLSSRKRNAVKLISKLPHYGFPEVTDHPQTALSMIMQNLLPHDRLRHRLQIVMIIAAVGGAILLVYILKDGPSFFRSLRTYLHQQLD